MCGIATPRTVLDLAVGVRSTLQFAPGHEARIDLSFTCLDPADRLERSVAFDAGPISTVDVVGAAAKTVNGFLTIADGYDAVAFNITGTVIARGAHSDKLILAPPASVAFVRGGSKVRITAARGDHLVRLVTWPHDATPVLQAWINREQSRAHAGARRFIACKSIFAGFVDALARFERAIAGSGPEAAPLAISVIYEVVTKLLLSPDSLTLAALPNELPPSIADLTKFVQQDPAAPWPLKDAAAHAGYSAFHFSRVFKQLVGYGFHEYVDRCRTETAVEMLRTGSQSVESVAASCGYGTTQGLRDSVREYLGIVPSELRTQSALD